MFATKVVVIVALAVVFGRQRRVAADPTGYGARASSGDELAACEGQLAKYRKFLLQTVISSGDLCEVYNARAYGRDEDGLAFLRNAPPTEQQAEMWAYFKLLVDQFNDAEFAKGLRDAVLEHCRLKSQIQLDEKRDSVVLGKKQRFHSWGGKRAPSVLETINDPKTGMDTPGAEYTGKRLYFL